jgi:ribosomal protein S18 acetylase RimI-like enzyme
VGRPLTLQVGAPRDPAGSGTTDQVVRLVQSVMGQGAALGWSGVPTREAAVAWWRQLMDDAAAGRAAVSAAYDGDELVGLGQWRRHPLGPQAHNADLEKMFVRDSVRGTGAGAQLMEHLLAQARSAGVEQMTLECRGNNHGAIRFYQRLGFTEYGRLPDFVAAGRDRWDKVLMSIDLRTGAEDLDRHGAAAVGEGSSP